MRGIIKHTAFNFSKLVCGNEVTIHYDIKADGSDVLNCPCGVCVLCENEVGIKEYIPLTDLDITDYTQPIDWEQRRYEIAKDLMTHTLNPETFPLDGISRIEAQFCIEAADELIKQLKGGEQ